MNKHVTTLSRDSDLPAPGIVAGPFNITKECLSCSMFYDLILKPLGKDYPDCDCGPAIQLPPGWIE